MSDNHPCCGAPKRLGHDAECSEATVTRFCVTCGTEATVHADGPHAWGLFFCAEHRGQMNSDEQRADRWARLERQPIGPAFVAPDRQRRCIAALRACILLQQAHGADVFRITGSCLSLDTGTVHGPDENCPLTGRPGISCTCMDCEADRR